MSTLPLAIYTATQGLSWNYPRGEIPFAELDACRKALCPLPDFDSGEPGYKGVWVTEARVFFLHCQSVPAWDFRGRNATYLAVTWVSRDEVGRFDIDALLMHSALCVPNRNPELFFDFAATTQGMRGHSLKSLPTTLSDGFRSVGALIATLAPNQTAKLRRKLTEQTVSCRYEVVSRVLQKEPCSSPQILSKPKGSSQASPRNVSVIMPAHVEHKDIKLLKIALVLTCITLLCSLIMNVYLGWPYLKSLWQDLACDKKPLTESVVSDVTEDVIEPQGETLQEKGNNELRRTESDVILKTIKDDGGAQAIAEESDKEENLKSESIDETSDERSLKMKELKAKGMNNE